VKQASNSYARKKINNLNERNNQSDNDDDENTDNLTRKIELYKHQIERKLENVNFLK
jgi:hypothetical protein